MATDFLKDKQFLKALDTLHIKNQFVRITILSWEEESIQEIQGVVKSGNITIDGKSSVRRTCQLSVYTEQLENDLTKITNLFSVNKKCKVEIGFENTIPEKVYYTGGTLDEHGEVQEPERHVINYQDMYGNFVWFPLGIFVFSNPSISHSLDGVNITLSLKDKMCLLNGSMGGVIPAATDFDILDDVRPDNDTECVKVRISQIIREVVNHFGKEDLSKIIIEDVPQLVKQVVSSNSDTPYYLMEQVIGTNKNYRLTFRKSEAKDAIIYKYEKHDDVGFILTDLTYPGELTIDAGGCVTDVLDKIIQVLGNYEYFYDVDGYFHFREIKNYLNMTQSWTWITNSGDYIYNIAQAEADYIFEGGELISSFNNSPDFENIKNDFVVWGQRTAADGTDIPIRYHLAIDERPDTGVASCAKYGIDSLSNHEYDHQVFFYTKTLDDDAIVYAQATGGNTSNQGPTHWRFSTMDAAPEVGNVGEYYTINGIRYLCMPNSLSSEEYTTKYVPISSLTARWIRTVDYREELYYQTLQSRLLGLSETDYGAELVQEWPKIYNLQTQSFKEETPEDYYFQIIDSNTSYLGQYGVNQIGRRSFIQKDENINCIFENAIPDVCYINTEDLNRSDIQQWCINNGQDWCQVSATEYKYLKIGAYKNGCYEKIKDLLYQYTQCNNNISFTGIPMYYLDVNTRITVKDDPAGISGDYIITSISIPLSQNDQMTINAYHFYDKI